MAVRMHEDTIIFAVTFRLIQAVQVDVSSGLEGLSTVMAWLVGIEQFAFDTCLRLPLV